MKLSTQFHRRTGTSRGDLGQLYWKSGSCTNSQHKFPRQRNLRIPRSQHISIFPTPAQTFTKSGISVGTEGAAQTSQQGHSSSEEYWRNPRASQSRSAIPRTSTSQQYALPELHRVAWRAVTLVAAGIAMALAKRPKRVMNDGLMFAFELLKVV